MPLLNNHFRTPRPRCRDHSRTHSMASTTSEALVPGKCVFPWNPEMTNDGHVSSALGVSHFEGTTARNSEYAEEGVSMSYRRRKVVYDSDTTQEACTGADDDNDDLPVSAKVWNTIELLELIFCHLSASDLVTASRVNDTFFQCITNSPLTQTKLLLCPSGRAARTWY